MPQIPYLWLPDAKNRRTAPAVQKVGQIVKIRQINAINQGPRSQFFNNGSGDPQIAGEHDQYRAFQAPIERPSPLPHAKNYQSPYFRSKMDGNREHGQRQCGAMGQHHFTQHGTFHVTTNAHDHISWCTINGIPEILINNLRTAKYACMTKVYAFSILPDHMHMMINPGKDGLSKFVQLFKKTSMREARGCLRSRNLQGDLRIADVRVDEITFVNVNAVHWQKGFFAREICNDRQWDVIMAYITTNPVRHGLVNNIGDWPWTSLHFPDVIDDCGMPR